MAELGIGDALLGANKWVERRFHVHGAYRPMVVVPSHLSLRTVAYSGPDELLVETDFQRLTGKRLNAGGAAANGADAATAAAVPPLRAVIAEFQLPAGSYATSVLREFCTCI